MRPGPATVSVLSGDVHHSYAARAELTAPRSVDRFAPPCINWCARRCTTTCPVFVKPAFRLGWSTWMAGLPGRWARRHGVPPLPVTWTNTCGPLFGNTIATLQVDGRGAEVFFEQPRRSDRTWKRSAGVTLSRPIPARWQRTSGLVEALADFALGSDGRALGGHPAGDLAGDVAVGQPDVGEHLTA